MEKAKCSHCNKEFNAQESLNQHIEAKHKKSTSAKPEKKIKKGRIILIIVAILILLISYLSYANIKKPGVYDSFAKCLTEKGAVIYGNDFCQYTAKQLNWFGKSERYLNYIKCANNKELCDTKGVKITPTWEINGKMYEQVQTFETLSQLTGCEIKSKNP